MRDFSDPLLTAFPAFAEATVRRFAEAGLIDCPLTDPEPPPVDRRKVRCAVVCDAAQGVDVLQGFWRVVYLDEYGVEYWEDLVPLADCPVRGEVEQFVLRIVADIAEAAEMRAAVRRKVGTT